MCDFIKALLAGFAISLGCIVSVSVGGGVIGAFLFSIGLITVCFYKLNLFTGKVCYLSKETGPLVMISLIGNIIAATVMGIAMSYIKPDAAEYLSKLSDAKLSEEGRVVLLAMLCNVMIFLAVDAWRRRKDDISGIFIIVLCVMVFILGGFEHCIANVFYLSASGALFTMQGLIYILLNIAGNAIGGIAIHLMFTLSEKGEP